MRKQQGYTVWILLVMVATVVAGAVYYGQQQAKWRREAVIAGVQKEQQALQALEKLQRELALVQADRDALTQRLAALEGRVAPAAAPAVGEAVKPVPVPSISPLTTPAASTLTTVNAAATAPVPPVAAPTPPAPTDWKAKSAELDRRLAIQAAVEQHRPVVGMSLAQLDAALGPPNAVNTTDTGKGLSQQRVYQRPGLIWYVYVNQQEVTGVQQSLGTGLPVAAGAGRCYTPEEIRDAEVSANSITLGDAERAQRRRQIAEMRRCG